jgi:hypothetical protein
MLFLSIVQNYFLWHYTRAFTELTHVWFNFIWFTINFFSIPQLMRSWFSPWKRISEERGNKWNFEDFAGFLLIGLISRIIGFAIRTTIIFSGLVALLLNILAGLAVYVLWIILPVIIIGMLVFGATLLIS